MTYDNLAPALRLPQFVYILTARENTVRGVSDSFEPRIAAGRY